MLHKQARGVPFARSFFSIPPVQTRLARSLACASCQLCHSMKGQTVREWILLIDLPTHRITQLRTSSPAKAFPESKRALHCQFRSMYHILEEIQTGLPRLLLIINNAPADNAT